jgi:uncharacterized membrane protein YfcA
MIKIVVLSVLGALCAVFLVVFLLDYIKSDKSKEDTSLPKTTVIGLITNFFDTLGIGSFAPTTALLKMFRQSQDKLIPGTLNVSCTVPVIMEAFIFITVIKVEPLTLVLLLASATLGAYLGAGIISKFSEKRIRIVMGFALLVTAFMMFSSQMGWMPGGGEEVGLHGGGLVIGVVGNFILGGLMPAGIGLYAPCMALIYFLGMSPRVAFPIMMGSCAFLMPVASIKFVREGFYNRKASLGITLGGIVGVLIAAFIVKSLPLNVLMWLVIAVVLGTSVAMLRAAGIFHKVRTEKAAADEIKEKEKESSL